MLSHFSPTLCNPIDGSPPGSPVPGILQARTLDWVAISFSNAWKWKVKVKSLSLVWLLATPWTAAHQAPPSMGFSRQECWSGVPLPSPNSLIVGSKWKTLYLHKRSLTVSLRCGSGIKAGHIKQWEGRGKGREDGKDTASQYCMLLEAPTWTWVTHPRERKPQGSKHIGTTSLIHIYSRNTYGEANIHQVLTVHWKKIPKAVLSWPQGP